MKNNILKLTFFGDSICVGQGVSIYRGWITRIAESLDSYVRGKGFDVLVTNSSVNGRTTRQALEDMPYHIQNSGVDLLVIQFGLNDCNYWASDKGVPRVSLEAYIANLKEICARGRNFGAEQIILNTNHPTTRNQGLMDNTTITYEQSNEAYNLMLRNTFLNYSDDLLLVDIYQRFLDKYKENDQLGSCLLPDQLHLSEKGHNEYYQVLYPIILDKVEGIARSRGWV